MQKNSARPCLPGISQVSFSSFDFLRARSRFTKSLVVRGTCWRQRAHYIPYILTLHGITCIQIVPVVLASDDMCDDADHPGNYTD